MSEFATYVGGSILGSFLVLLVLWLGREWILARLTNSIRHDYDKKLEKYKHEFSGKLEEYKHEHTKKLEEYKYEIERRKKVEMVARLLAHWLKHSEDQEELNRLTFECFLWLPDNIAKDLSDLLSHEQESNVSIRSILHKIRNHLNSEEKESGYDQLQDYQIIVFTQELKSKSLKRAIDSLK